MATSTRDSKKDHQTTRLFVLSLTAERERETLLKPEIFLQGMEVRINQDCEVKPILEVWATSESR